MAKRKRLTPAAIAPSEAGAAPLETKGLKNGWAGTQVHSGATQAPIADVAGSAAAAAALDELAHELETARRQGRLVIKADLEAIDDGYLVRDRAQLDPVELDVLKTSLAARGQQTPIEVVDLRENRFGLISGWRRLTALRALHAENPEGGFGHVQCLIRTPTASSQAYIAMVEENEIRTGLSFYERARIAVRAVEQGAFEDPRAAAKALFSAAPRAKRSKIYSFIRLYTALDDVLNFPSGVSERLGLALVKRLEADAAFETALRKAHKQASPSNMQAEMDLLESLLKSKGKATRASHTETLAKGLRWSQSSGKLVLSGPAVTEAFLEELKDLLKEKTEPNQR